MFNWNKDFFFIFIKQVFIHKSSILCIHIYCIHTNIILIQYIHTKLYSWYRLTCTYIQNLHTHIKQNIHTSNIFTYIHTLYIYNTCTFKIYAYIYKHTLDIQDLHTYIKQTFTPIHHSYNITKFIYSSIGKTLYCITMRLNSSCWAFLSIDLLFSDSGLAGWILASRSFNCVKEFSFLSAARSCQSPPFLGVLIVNALLYPSHIDEI